MTKLTPCENRHYSFKVYRILVKSASAVNCPRVFSVCRKGVAIVIFFT